MDRMNWKRYFLSTVGMLAFYRQLQQPTARDYANVLSTAYKHLGLHHLDHLAAGK